jgi:hypothetical protein
MVPAARSLRPNMVASVLIRQHLAPPDPDWDNPADV